MRGPGLQVALLWQCGMVSDTLRGWQQGSDVATAVDLGTIRKPHKSGVVAPACNSTIRETDTEGS